MMNLKQKIFFSLMICFCTLIGPVFSQNTYHFKGKRNKQLLAFTKTRGLIVLTTYINDKGPFNFILDSGVGIMVITDPKLKDSLQLTYLRKFTLMGLGEGSEIDAYTTSFLKIEIGATIAESTSAAILDKDVFDLSSYAGMPIHGLIGYDFFQSFVIRVFYEGGYLALYRKGKAKLFRKGTRLPINIENNKPYINVWVDEGDLKKTPLKMLIDTGAGHAMSLESYKNEPFPLPDQFMIANLGVGLSGDIGGFLGRVTKLKLGKFEIDHLISSFPHYEDVAAKVLSTPRNGSIGNQLLKRFEIIFDYDAGCIYLKPNSLFKGPFEHDMSGMELSAAGDDYKRYFVNRVEPQSPADEFGIQKNDEVISVNFRQTGLMTFDELTELFKSKDGRNLFIRIQRGSKVFEGILTLKRRI